MISGSRYAHTNLVAHDWRALAGFYESVFSGERVPPIRDFPAAEVESGTGVPGAGLQGSHLRLPGHGPNGPTIEIFTYTHQFARSEIAANRQGYGHIRHEQHAATRVHNEVFLERFYRQRLSESCP